MEKRLFYFYYVGSQTKEIYSGYFTLEEAIKFAQGIAVGTRMFRTIFSIDMYVDTPEGLKHVRTQR